jgi:hypothetical protein
MKNSHLPILPGGLIPGHAAARFFHRVAYLESLLIRGLK